MRILVTGGTGNVGRETVRQLLQMGHMVRVIGRREGMRIEGAEYRACDTTDFPALRMQMVDIDAVIHLAAIPHPAGGASQEIFRVNCLGTYHVYQAAAEAGIKRVVTASSINAFGFNFGIQGFPIEYLPIDEAHPTHTTDAYSFSKQVTEDIADYFWRREGISGVCLRLPAVIEIERNWESWRNGVKEQTVRLFQELRDNPAVGKEHVARVMQTLEQMRRERIHESRARSRFTASPEMLISVGWTNFWTGLDTRDTAQALIKGVLADYQGSHPLFVNDSLNIVGLPSADLAAVFFPQVNTYKQPLDGQTALVSIGRARQLIGFEPEYHLAEM